jgi:preprotein translocase subunit SecA
MSPKAIHQRLLELSRSWNGSLLTEEIDNRLAQSCDPGELSLWANQRYQAGLKPDSLAEKEQARQTLLEAGRNFLRRELADLERYVLVQIYDSAWKDHLYAMDHLKESIMLRAYAERDPKIEYKHEGYRMFSEMLQTIADRVSDIIFKVRLEAGTRARNVWQVSSASHDQVGQFEMAARQRAAATAPQGEQKTKTIRVEKEKVGRNDPCPCGSGKKYKKCCGKNA